LFNELLPMLEEIVAMADNISYTNFIKDTNLQQRCLEKIKSVKDFIEENETCLNVKEEEKEKEEYEKVEKEKLESQKSDETEISKEDIKNTYNSIKEEIKNIYNSVNHEKFGINPETLWDVIKLDMPFQIKRMKTIMETA